MPETFPRLAAPPETSAQDAALERIRTLHWKAQTAAYFRLALRFLDRGAAILRRRGRRQQKISVNQIAEIAGTIQGTIDTLQHPKPARSRRRPARNKKAAKRKFR
jgi:hypothetical protein